MQDNIALYKYFFESYFSLNASGDPKKTYDLCISQVEFLKEQGKTPHDSEEYSIHYFSEKYKQYLNYWDRNFGSKDQKYISGKDKKLNPYDFIVHEKYNEVYNEAGTPRDKYLFGSVGKDRMLKIIQKIKEEEYGIKPKEPQSDFDVLNEQTLGETKTIESIDDYSEESDPFDTGF